MPRTWSYRKRDYELAAPVAKGIPPTVIGMMILYGLMLTALGIGMTFTMTHKIKVTDPEALMSPVPQPTTDYRAPKED